MSQQPKVFISHTTRDRRDHSLAHKLAAGLRDRGSQVWIAPDDVPVGSEWKREIVAGIMECCTHFLVILSAASTDAEWVLKEITLAAERRAADASFTILPLFAGRVGVYQGSDFIDCFQRVPYHERFTEQLNAVVHGLDLRSGVSDRYVELTEGFVGRDYVFAAIDEFLTTNRSGCFTVVGDPGEGKSAILAEYVRRTGCVAHFNLCAQGINRTSQCIKSINAQLTARYGLSIGQPPPDPWEYGAHWEELLRQATSKLDDGDQLVIAIDALDEVDMIGHPLGTNILFMPRYLPDGVYFVLTRRRLDVPFVNTAAQQTYNLLQHREGSLRDIRTYIRRATERQKLQEWIDNHGIGAEDFVEILADKSEFNFMYLHYVLPDIEKGVYQELDVESIPVGLQGYYEDHWVRMGMTRDPLPRGKIRVIYVMAEVRSPVSRELISQFVEQDGLTVQATIEEWRQFLHEQTFDGQPRYSVYHTSFLDFLRRKDTVQAAGETIKGVNAAIADVLWRDIMGDD